MNRRGVTMIELLVVIAIMAILAGMIVQYEWVDDEEAALNQAAIELRATMRKARALAMRENKTYAITFNLESPGGGEVVRNFAADDPIDFRGRHWYAIVGPADKNDTRQYSDLWRPPGVDSINGIPDAAPDIKRDAFMDIVERHLVGPRHYLPRKVRFLALSDLDGGADVRGFPRYAGDFGNWGRDAYGMVYPVPWSGTAIPDGGGFRLVPWGFYDEQLARHGVTGNMGWRGNACGTRSAFGAADDYPHFQSGGVTRLAEGLMMDAYLEFSPDGSVRWKHDYYNKWKIGDKVWCGDGNGTAALDWTSIQRSEITGGFHITLARDVDESEPIYQGGFDRFASERDALQSITPFARVFIHERSGQTEIRRGLPKAPRELHWTLGAGTVQDASAMGSVWQGIDPFCRVQQSQKLYHKSNGDTASPRAYHVDGNPFVSFKPAGSW